MKKLALSLIVIIYSLIFILPACSSSPAPINVDADGIALKSYDPVAYFTVGLPVKGRQEFQYEWQGAKWVFSSLEHLALFQKNPGKFAPQYGGY